MARTSKAQLETSDELAEIKEVEVSQLADKRYVPFIMESNERQIPDIRDGLKPAHRHTLLTFRDLGSRPGGQHIKCAKVASQTIGDYHPHADVGIYDSLVSMTQDWSYRYPIIDFHGNNGNIDGSGPGASRYTECRIGPVGFSMLEDLYERKAHIVPWSRNYLNDRDEPLCLPGRFPALLVNGVLAAIGTGFSAVWLPMNLREMVDAIVMVIDKPESTVDDLLKHIKGPDFPTGGVLMGIDGFRDALGTGRGRVVLRAKVAVEEEGKDTLLVVSEIPWQKDIDSLISQIKQYAVGKAEKSGKTTKIDGITDVSDQSGNEWRTDMRIVIKLHRSANPQIVAAQLYKYTGLEVSFTIQQRAYVDGLPKILTTPEAIANYISTQLDVLTRRTNYLRSVALAEFEVQEAYVKAEKFANKLVPFAQGFDGRAELEAHLPELIPGLTPRQCEVVAGMALFRFNKIDATGARKKMTALQVEIAEYDRLLGSDTAMRDLLKVEIRKIKTDFGDDRRTAVITAPEAEISVKNIDEMTPDEPCWLALSGNGLISRLPDSAFKVAKRGGVTQSASRSEEDPATEIRRASTRDRVWAITDRGNLFAFRVADLDELSKGARGTNISRFCKIEQTEHVVTLLVAPTKTANGDRDLVIATADGKVLRTKITEFANISIAGLTAIKLVGDDKIVSAALVDAKDHLIFVSTAGMAARFAMSEMRPTGRGAQGVDSMKLHSGVTVVSANAVKASDKRDLAVVCSNGRGKRTTLSEYPVKGRAIGGVTAIGLEAAGKGKIVTVAFAAPVADDDTVVLTTSAGRAIRLTGNEIKRQGRSTAGVIVVNFSAAAKTPEMVTGGTVATA